MPPPSKCFRSLTAKAMRFPSVSKRQAKSPVAETETTGAPGTAEILQFPHSSLKLFRCPHSTGIMFILQQNGSQGQSRSRIKNQMPSGNAQAEYNSRKSFYGKKDFFILYLV